MTSSAPYTFVTAFSSNPFGGNLAAIVFLDPLATPFDVQHGLSLNFNQPMTVFVKPVEAPIPGTTILQTDIRFMPVSGRTVEICGHGSLAAAKALLSLPQFSGQNITEVQFRALKGRVITIWVRDGGLLEMELPAGETVEVSEDEVKRVAAVVNRGFGREVKIKRVAAGIGAFEHALMVEIDEAEDLESSKVNAAVIHETGYSQNVITSNVSASKGVQEIFVSRMFSPEVPGGEDAVCGSAHCLMVPYWYGKTGLQSGKPAVARQVSQRGGVLKVLWNAEKGVISLSGPATLTATGDCYY